MDTNFNRLLKDFTEKDKMNLDRKRNKMLLVSIEKNEFVLGYILETDSYMEMNYNGFSRSIPIKINVDDIRRLIMVKYELVITPVETVSIIRDAIEAVNVFKHVQSCSDYVMVELDFTKIENEYVKNAEFDVKVDVLRVCKLNVRETPSRLCNVVRTLDPETIVHVYGEINGFYKISGGYIDKKFTNKIK